eukprot:TRINITY_DN41207_c0_g1_i1.p1 TRINITY_DN41207_c0_g1~~TRINITY_DN41207_c0_g1_i1.p1  ORF type:complete len:212 (+),score=19.36 TRINITY_DN41207_c0_g1_i1:60-638(+)
MTSSSSSLGRASSQGKAPSNFVQGRPPSSSAQGSEVWHQVWGRVEQTGNCSSSSGSYGEKAGLERAQSLPKHVTFHDSSNSSREQDKDKTQVHASSVAAAHSETKKDVSSAHEIAGLASRFGRSQGSAGHHELPSLRTCKPCAWNWKLDMGCVKGESCPFCHMCDETAYRKAKQLKLKEQRKLMARQPKLSL